MLPGTPITYYGEEIGMTDFVKDVNDDDDDDNDQDDDDDEDNYMTVDRNPSRTPMQWSNRDPNAGFSNCPSRKTWLPINPNFATGINVQDQEGKDKSILTSYKVLSNLRYVIYLSSIYLLSI